MELIFWQVKFGYAKRKIELTLKDALKAAMA